MTDGIIESFTGFVMQVDGDTAYVRLQSDQHHDIIGGEYSTSKLAALGIFERKSFTCLASLGPDGTRISIKPMPPRELPDERLREIREKINKELGKEV